MEALLAVLRVFDVLAFLSGAARLAENAGKAHPQFQDNSCACSGLSEPLAARLD